MNNFDILLSDRQGIATVLDSFFNPGNHKHATEYEKAMLALAQAYNYGTSEKFSEAAVKLAKLLTEQAERAAAQWDKEQAEV